MRNEQVLQELLETSSEEAQIAMAFEPLQTFGQLKAKYTDNLNVLSLFSGCGGMDLGFEGGFYYIC